MNKDNDTKPTDVTPPAQKTAPVEAVASEKVMPIRDDVKPNRAEPTKPTEYPFDNLKIGQSFGVRDSSVAEMATPVTAANRKGEKYFYAEAVDPKTDPDKANVRVWRKK